MPKTHDVYVIKATRPPAKYAECESFEDALIKGDGLYTKICFLAKANLIPSGVSVVIVPHGSIPEKIGGFKTHEYQYGSY